MRRSDRTGGPEEVLEEWHGAAALLVGTLVASPVLLAALSGRQGVATAAALYVAAIVGSWVVLGVVIGALAMAAPVPAEIVAEPSNADSGSSQDQDPEPATASR